MDQQSTKKLNTATLKNENFCQNEVIYNLILEEISNETKLQKNSKILK
jgi:hypothetical protein